ncbi:hypothetical protein QYE76_009578 [Lolium multiflorum]|uniref:4Fe-4S ferredoxin-type domain-containing protein n=1 Tax=Lolium multiflorum TaxID=4521 RepID=A0AAD8X1D2_LOLMU|nr:hypothetical protein QYE76_009578 [Lolium multiflorum]
MAWWRLAAVDVLIPFSHFDNRGGGSSRFCPSGLVLRGVACRDASDFDGVSAKAPQVLGCHHRLHFPSCSLPPPPTPALQLLSSPTLSLSFGGQLQQQQLLPSPPTPQRLLPPPTSLPFGDVGDLGPGLYIDTARDALPPGLFPSAVTASGLDRYPPRVGGEGGKLLRAASLCVGVCGRCVICSCSSFKLRFIAQRTSISSAASGSWAYGFPTGGGHAVFPAGSDLKVCAIDSHSAGRRHGVTDRSSPRSTTAFRRRPPRGLLLSLWFPWDPGGCTGCSSRTSCVSRWGVVLEYVMALGRCSERPNLGRAKPGGAAEESEPEGGGHWRLFVAKEQIDELKEEMMWMALMRLLTTKPFNVASLKKTMSSAWAPMKEVVFHELEEQCLRNPRK